MFTFSYLFSKIDFCFFFCSNANQDIKKKSKWNDSLANLKSWHRKWDIKRNKNLVILFIFSVLFLFSSSFVWIVCTHMSPQVFHSQCVPSAVSAVFVFTFHFMFSFFCVFFFKFFFWSYIFFRFFFSLLRLLCFRKLLAWLSLGRVRVRWQQYKFIFCLYLSWLGRLFEK